jgi:hypothetical protein
VVEIGDCMTTDRFKAKISVLTEGSNWHIDGLLYVKVERDEKNNYTSYAIVESKVKEILEKNIPLEKTTIWCIERDISCGVL